MATSSDDVIWQLINNGFCSYKSKIETNTFCRNKFNVTGLCTRQSCPLANSRYATVIEKDGICYLKMKTIERSHMPANLWESIPLHKNYAKALEEIDKHLIYWPKFIIHKVKQRFTKITQYLIRMRKLKKKEDDQRIPVIYRKKVEKRLDKREQRALQVSRLDQKIKKEIIERLKKGTYGDIYNFDQTSFDTVLDEQGMPLEEEQEIEDEFVGEIDEDFGEINDIENNLGDDDLSFDEDNPFNSNNDEENDGNERNSNNENNQDFFEPDDIGELDKLFKSYTDKDLQTPINKKKRKYIEIEMEKEDDIQDTNKDI